MKKINILYWTFTGIFGAFMLFSAIPDIMMVPDAMEYVSNRLGYPTYLVAFLGVAKTLGVIAILIPGFPRVREWAYAGLFFDLLGATYSVLMVEGPNPGMLFMIIPFSFLFLSYHYCHKRDRLRGMVPTLGTA